MNKPTNEIIHRYERMETMRDTMKAQKDKKTFENANIYKSCRFDVLIMENIF